ncbi:hypothetical protein ACOSQ2_030834 [Xanthoceras sorbifolium]
MSSSYHPQTDGQTEVVNQTLEQYLRCFAGDQPRKWMDRLPWAEFSYNTSLHSATKTTPFEVVYGIQPPGLLPYVPGTTRVQVVEEYLHDRTTEHMKKQVDRSRREVQFQAGYFVYLKLHPYRQTSVAFRSSMKLSPRFFGPFEILEKIGQVAYRLALPPGAQIHDVVHVSHLRKHLSDRPPALPSLLLVSDEPRTEVLVKWAGASMEDAT